MSKHTANHFPECDTLLPYDDKDMGTGTEASPDGICDHCSGCITLCRYEPYPNEAGFFRLINAMVYEINSLESEVIRCRQALMTHLSREWADGMRQEIFSGLSQCFQGEYEAYDRFVDVCHEGIDPMSDQDIIQLHLRLRDGLDETSYRHLWAPGFKPVKI